MDEDMVADLKQFIASLIGQQTVELRSEFRTELQTEIAKTNKKIDDLSAAVAEALESSNEVTAAQLKNHEHRIIRLEHKIT